MRKLKSTLIVTVLLACLSLTALGFVAPSSASHFHRIESIQKPTKQQQLVNDNFRSLSSSCLVSLDQSRSNISAALFMNQSSDEKLSDENNNWGFVATFAGIAFLYWYLLVLGAAAQANGLPVPEFVPMTPGWPASEQDFQPVIEDSFHFFYLSELLGNESAPQVQPVRLAIFNLVEAWVFGLLPALWKDPKRLSRPILLGSWLVLGINLTNAFLAPYLMITEAKRTMLQKNIPKNRIVSQVFGVISAAVVSFALFQVATVATTADWNEFGELVKTDRSYLAFCVDPILLSAFQPIILSRTRNGANEPLDYVPFVGLIGWLFSSDDE